MIRFYLMNPVRMELYTLLVESGSSVFTQLYLVWSFCYLLSGFNTRVI